MVNGECVGKGAIQLHYSYSWFLYISVTVLTKCLSIISLLDINECAFGPRQCSQLCINTQGSFTCGCQDGFRLDTDGRSCISKF